MAEKVSNKPWINFSESDYDIKNYHECMLNISYA